MNCDVFISYKSEDKTQALWIKENLEANNVSCWMAPESIPGGSNYATEIADAMAQCRCVVVVFTEKTQTSMWGDKDIELALNMQKRVLPFMMKAVALQGGFQLYLSNVQQYAAYANPKAALKELIRDIRAEMGTPVTAPKIVSKPPRDTRQVGAAGLIGLVIGLLLAAAILWLVISEVGSPLLGIEPNHGTATTTESALLTDGTTTGANSMGTDGTTEWDSTNESATATTTGAAAQPNAPHVIGEAVLNAKLGVGQLSQDLTNLSRDTAATIPFDALVGCVLEKDEAHWYTFTTTEVVVHRIAVLRVENMDGYFTVEATLYNEKGIKQSSVEFDNNSYVNYEYVDVVLEPNTKYYVKMNGINIRSDSYAGYGLFIEPKENDTGLSQEDATEISLGEQYEFVLNSTLEDWLVLRCEDGGMYTIQLHNIDVGEKIQLTCVKEGSSNKLCTVYADDEDSGTKTFRIEEGATVYMKVSMNYFNTDCPNGTYVVEVTKD